MATFAETSGYPAGKAAGSTVLTSHRMPLPATFRFDYFGMAFDVGVRHKTGGGAELVVRGRLGEIPYSAESVAARDFLLSLIDAGRSLPMVEIGLDRRQSIIARGSMTFQAVPSPANVAAGTAAFIIAVKPVCELIIKSRNLPRH